MQVRWIHIVDDRWQHFQIDPSEVPNTTTSSEILSNFQQCVLMIVKVAGAVPELKDLPETLYFKYPPNVTGLNERIGIASPDCVLYLKESSLVVIPEEYRAKDEYCWLDTVVPIEFLPTRRISTFESGDDGTTNALKLCWSATNIFAADLCRNAVYGITIEDTTLRLWNFTRAGLIVSEELDWCQDLESFACLVISLVFADKTSLGYDRSIKRVWLPDAQDERNLQYSIIIGKNIYHTIGAPLSYSNRLDLITGCGTSLYKVFQVSPMQSKTISTLKISWNYFSTSVEGEQLENLSNAALEKGSWNAEFFLAPKAYERCIDTEYYTAKEYYGNKFGATKRKALALNTCSLNSRMSNESDDATESTGSLSPKIDYFGLIFYDCHAPLFQDRVLYAEVGIPLHQIDNVSDYFRALGAAALGLMFLHELGFVHRDLTTNSIRVMRDSRNRTRIKLAEVTYMRSINDYEEVEDPTYMGSSEFSAVEIQERLYLFREAENEKVNDIADYVAKSIADFQAKRHERRNIIRVVGKTERDKQSQADLSVPVHNAIHDIEALFWMGLWFLCYRVSIDYMDTESKLEGQSNAASRLFTTHGSVIDPPPDRSQVLLYSAGLKRVLLALPSEFHYAAECLRIVRNVLHMIYVEKESNPDWNGPISMIGMLPIQHYYTLRDIFVQCRDDKTKLPVRPVTLHGRDILSPYGKRKSEDK